MLHGSTFVFNTRDDRRRYSICVKNKASLENWILSIRTTYGLQHQFRAFRNVRTCTCTYAARANFAVLFMCEITRRQDPSKLLHKHSPNKRRQQRRDASSYPTVSLPACLSLCVCVCAAIACDHRIRRTRVRIGVEPRCLIDFRRMEINRNLCTCLNALCRVPSVSVCDSLAGVYRPRARDLCGSL